MKCLWTDRTTGQASSSKLWRNVAFAVVTYLMLKTQAEKPDWMVLLVYLGAVGGVEFVQQVLTMKLGAGKEDAK